MFTQKIARNRSLLIAAFSLSAALPQLTAQNENVNASNQSNCSISRADLQESGPAVEESSLVEIPAHTHDPAIGNGCAASLSTHVSGLAAPAISPSGWTVTNGTVREFASVDNLRLFSIAAVTSGGRKGVLFSRGIAIQSNGSTTVNWVRSVIPNDQLGEYARLQTYEKSLSFGTIFSAPWKLVWSKVLSKIGDEFGSAVADAIGSLIKWVDSTCQSIMSDLLDPNNTSTSEVPKLLLANMQTSNATDQAVNRYLTSIVASRASTYSLSDQVYVSLYNGIVVSADKNAGRALAAAIEQFK
jgi:hypothetical protein